MGDIPKIREPHMFATHKRVTVSLAIVLALAVTPAVAGCSVIKGVIEQQTGGKVDLGGKSIPANFPTSEVPLISGDIVYGAGIATAQGDVWNVTVNVKDMNAFDTITSQLTGAGFAANDVGSKQDDGTAAGTFTTDKYSIAVVVTKGSDAGTLLVNYTVTSIKE
jgi:hypothetical protein